MGITTLKVQETDDDDEQQRDDHGDPHGIR
jgi:hypothetical protein